MAVKGIAINGGMGTLLDKQRARLGVMQIMVYRYRVEEGTMPWSAFKLG